MKSRRIKDASKLPEVAASLRAAEQNAAAAAAAAASDWQQQQQHAPPNTDAMLENISATWNPAELTTTSSSPNESIKQEFAMCDSEDLQDIVPMSAQWAIEKCCSLNCSTCYNVTEPDWQRQQQHQQQQQHHDQQQATLMQCECRDSNNCTHNSTHDASEYYITSTNFESSRQHEQPHQQHSDSINSRFVVHGHSLL